MLRHGRLAAILLAVAVAVFGQPVVGTLTSPAAYAASVSGAITSVNIVKTTVAQNQNTAIDLTWKVPDGTKAGDTFSMTLPADPFASITSPNFTLTDPATGSVVANAVVTGLTVTFTMTVFAQQHVDVAGTATVTAKVAANATVGPQNPTISTTGKDFTDPVTITAGTGQGENTKVGSIGTSGGHPVFDWQILTGAATGAQTMHIVDTPVAPLTIDCSTIVVRIDAYIRTGMVTSCSPTELVIDAPVKDGQVVKVVGTSDFPADATVGTNYTNTAAITIDGTIHHTSKSVQYPDTGGTGSGNQFVGVGDSVWFDTNHDGVHDPGEPGLAGVALTITRTDGRPVTDYQGGAYDTTTVSAADGSYDFDRLPVPPAGVEYVVTADPDSYPAGWYPTIPGADSHTGSGTTSGLTTLGDRDDSVDFGFWKPVPALTVVKGDSAGNAGDTEATAADLGMAPGSATLVYTATNTGNEPLSDVALTDAVSGTGDVTGLSCAFPGGGTGVSWGGPLTPGASFTCSAHLGGVAYGVMHTDVATVAGTGTTTGARVRASDPYNAHATSVPTVSVGDRVALDTDHDGVQAPADPGVAGVVLAITRTDGRPALTAVGSNPGTRTTDASGAYLFAGMAVLPAGVRYRVTLDPATVPAGLYPTLTGQGTPATDSSTGSATSTDLTTDGQSDMSLDFEFWKPAPAVAITKSDSRGNAADTQATAADVGVAPGSADLTYTVSNTGNEPLTELTVIDLVQSNGDVQGLSCVFPDGASGVAWSGPFVPGTHFACTARLTGVLPGPTFHHDIGSVVATGTTTHTGVSASDDYWATSTAVPAIDVEKTDATGRDADTPETAVDLGDAPGSVDLRIVVRNTGSDPLTGVSVSDASTNGTVENLSCGWPDGSHGTTWPGPLDVGATVDCTGHLTGVLVASGGHHDIVSATATGRYSGSAVQDEDAFWAVVDARPAITITKSDAAGNAADSQDTAAGLGTAPGSARIVYVVTNSGSEPLSPVRVSDTVVSNGVVAGLSCVFPDGKSGTDWPGVLSPGVTFGCAATLTGVLPGPAHRDTASVTGTGTVTGRTVAASNDYWATASASPRIGVQKTDAAGHDANLEADAVDLGQAPGSAILRYRITNLGDEPLTDIAMSDVVKANGDVAGLVCGWPDGSAGVVWHGTLDPGAHIDCTADLTGVQAGAAHEDTGTVSGTGVYSGTTVLASDDWWATARATHPSIDVEKADIDGRDADTTETAADLGYGPASTRIRFVLANRGDEGLRDLDLTDRDLAANGTVAGLSCNWPDGTHGATWAGPLDVGGRVECTADLTGVQAGDPHRDEATVTATGVRSGADVADTDPYVAVAHAKPVPGIAIVKMDAAGHDANTDADAAPLGHSPAGTTLVYRVTNTGDEPLSGTTITDQVLAGGTVTGLACVFPDGTTGTIWRGRFDPGATFGCTSTLSGVTDAQLHHDRASVTAAGVVTGGAVTADDDYWASATVALHPALHIEKTDAAGHDADTEKSAVDLGDAPGSADLRYVVSNTGNETVTGISVTDVVRRNGTVTGLTCVFPDGTTGGTWPGRLSPGGWFTCAASLTGVAVSPAHLDLATVTGSGVESGLLVADDDPFWATAVPPVVVHHPAIDVEKMDADGHDADTEKTAVNLGVEPGSTGLRYVIRNTGDEPLDGLTIRDRVLANGRVSGLSCIWPDGTASGPSDTLRMHWSGVFAPGASATCVAALSAVASGTAHHDLATVTATGAESQATVTDSDPLWAVADVKPVVHHPAIDVQKTDAAGHDADTPADAVSLGIEPGATGLRYVVRNTGDEALTAVRVTDAIETNGVVTGLVCAFPDGSTGTVWVGPFAARGSFHCTARLTGVMAGAIHLDDATVTATGDESGTAVSDRDPFYAAAIVKPVVHHPAIDVEKTDAAGHDADTPSTAVALPDGSGRIVFTLVNTGDEALVRVALTDAVVAGGTVAGLSCDWSAYGGPATGTTFPGPWLIGAEVRCTAAVSGVRPGREHQDVARVTAAGQSSGAAVADSDPFYATYDEGSGGGGSGGGGNGGGGGGVDSGLPGAGSSGTLLLAGLILAGAGSTGLVLLTRRRRRDAS